MFAILKCQGIYYQKSLEGISTYDQDYRIIKW